MDVAGCRFQEILGVQSAYYVNIDLGTGIIPRVWDMVIGIDYEHRLNHPVVETKYRKHSESKCMTGII